MRLLNRSAGRISRHRRGPLAGLLVILFGLLLTGGLYTAMLTPATAHESKSDTELIKEGRELFLVGCAFCHGQNGEGVLTEDGKQNLGPAIVGAGAAAAHFQLTTGRMPLVQPGAQDHPKDPSYNPEEIAAIAAYVGSLGPGPGIPSSSDYTTDGLSEDAKAEAIVRGGEIFLTNCTACHNFGGNGGAMPWGKIAPALADTDSQLIYEAMQTGPGEMPVFSPGNLSPEEKRDIIAYVRSLNTTPEYGGFGMAGIGPVSEGLFSWLVGIGALVGFAYWIAAHTARTEKDKVEA